MNAQPENKRMSHRAALIFLLRDSEWHSMRECMEAGGYRYGGRLHELRKDGFAIETRRDGNEPAVPSVVEDAERQRGGAGVHGGDLKENEVTRLCAACGELQVERDAIFENGNSGTVISCSYGHGLRPTTTLCYPREQNASPQDDGLREAIARVRTQGRKEAMSEDLKPCPFCGGKAKADKFPWYLPARDNWTIKCVNCDAHGSWRSCECLATAAWNRRTP